MAQTEADPPLTCATTLALFTGGSGAADVLIADRGPVLTDLHPALLALVALAARDSSDDLRAVADLPARAVGLVDHGADRHDLTGDLMPGDPRRGEVLVTVAEDP